MKLLLSIVVAMARNRVIGHNGELPWRMRDDLKWFKQTTMGKPIIMGRKTFESIGKALPGRQNIVITRQNNFSAPDIETCPDFLSALDTARRSQPEEICIIGGGAIYRDTLALVDRLYITEIEATPEGDTYFPIFNEQQWTSETVGTISRDENNEYYARLLILNRRKRD